MAYKMTVLGQEVICDSPEEVAALLHLGSKTASRRDTVKQTNVIRSMVDSLAADQKQFVTLLNGAWPESRTDSDLRDEMRLSGNKKLGGLRAGVTRAAERAGINRIVRHESIRDGMGNRVHKYWLEDDAHAALVGENS